MSQNHLRFFLILITSIGITGAIITMWQGPRRVEVYALHQPTNKWYLEVADDQTSRSKGLMYRSSLAANSGMLFVFPDLQPRTFWMQNTYISLDIVFLDEQKRVVKLYTNTIPNQVATLYHSEKPIRYVIEFNSGTVSAGKIQLDTQFHFSL